MKTGSWVILDKKTKKAVAEVFDDRSLKNLNKEKYEAVTILEHLQSLNH